MGFPAERAHRRAEAEAGFPLLRGCPSTFVQRWLLRVEGMDAAERVALAEGISDLSEAQAAGPLDEAARGTFLAAHPLLQQALGSGPEVQAARCIPVKIMALLLKEQGGFEGVARLFGLEGARAEPPRPHVTAWDEAVPAKPAALRKAAEGAVLGRFGGTLRRDGEMSRIVAEDGTGVDLIFAAPGRPGARQMMASLRATGRPLAAYEALWLLPMDWNLITAGKLDATVAHLVRVLEVRLALGT